MFYVLVITSVRDERDLKRLVADVRGRSRAIHGPLAAGIRLWPRHVDDGHLSNGREWTRPTTTPTRSPPRSSIRYLWSWPLWQARTQEVAWLGTVGLRCVGSGLRPAYRFADGVCRALRIGADSRVDVQTSLAQSFSFWPSPRRWRGACCPPTASDRYLTMIDPAYGPANAQQSAESRWQGWHDGVRLWQENPLLGVGPGAFGLARGYALTVPSSLRASLG